MGEESIIKKLYNPIISEQNNNNEYDGFIKQHRTSKITNMEKMDIEKFDQNISITANKYQSQENKKEENENKLQEVDILINEVKRVVEVDYETAAYGFCDLCQKGGYLKTVQNRITLINGVTISKTIINNALMRKNIKSSLRVLARAFRDTILKSSRARQVPGHLFPQYKQYLIQINRYLDEETLMEHSFYCTDFQIGNSTMPNEVARFHNQRTIYRNVKKR